MRCFAISNILRMVDTLDLFVVLSDFSDPEASVRCLSSPRLILLGISARGETDRNKYVNRLHLQGLGLWFLNDNKTE